MPAIPTGGARAGLRGSVRRNRPGGGIFGVAPRSGKLRLECGPPLFLVAETCLWGG